MKPFQKREKKWLLAMCLVAASVPLLHQTAGLALKEKPLHAESAGALAKGYVQAQRQFLAGEAKRLGNQVTRVGGDKQWRVLRNQMRQLGATQVEAENITRLAARFRRASLTDMNSQIFPSLWPTAVRQGFVQKTAVWVVVSTIWDGSSTCGNMKFSPEFDEINLRLTAGTLVITAHAPHLCYLYPAWYRNPAWIGLPAAQKRLYICDTKSPE